MKKKLAILLAVLLFCSTLTPALAGFRLSRVYSACVFQDVLYYLQDEKIWLRKTHLDPEELFIDLAEWPQIPEGQKKNVYLLSDQNALYLLYRWDGMLYNITNGDLQEVVKLDFDGLGIESERVGYDVNFVHERIADGYFYALFWEPVNYSYVTLYRFSLKDGHQEKLGEPNTLRCVIPYKDGKLLIRDSRRRDVYLFDSATGEIGESLFKLPKGNCGSLVYDDEKDTIYYLYDRIFEDKETGLTYTLRQPYLMEVGKEDVLLDYGPYAAGVTDSYASMWNDMYFILADGQLYVCSPSSYFTTSVTLPEPVTVPE